MVNQALLQILNDGEFHTETQLATLLGISLPVLRQEIQALQAQGLELDNESRSDYRFPPGIKLLDKSQIFANLSEYMRESCKAFDIHLTIDSTNSEAMRWLSSGASGLALFMAEQQTGGRGRRGRHWVSPMARNLYLSLVCPVANLDSALQGISLVTALSVVHGLHRSGVQGKQLLRVKWPNDVWLGDAKLAGILLELHGGKTGPHHVVIGIGVNVHMPTESRSEIAQAVSDLYSFGNGNVNRNQLTAEILNSLVENLEILRNQGFDVFHRQWQELDVFHNREVSIRSGSQHISGVVKGVSSTGALILQTETGDRHVTGGEITHSLRPVELQAEVVDRTHDIGT